MLWPWRKSLHNTVSTPSEWEALETSLYAYFLRAVGDREEAQNLTNDTIAIVCEALEKGVPLREPVDHYAFGIAFKKRADYFRAVYRQPKIISVDEVQPKPEVPLPCLEMAQSENIQYIQRILATIQALFSKDNDRSVERVIALIYQGESQEKIATILSLPASTVRSHLLRGRGRLLAHLVEHDPDLLGGVDAIDLAWEAALKDTPPPTEAEIAAWTKRKPLEAFRAACLKMAKHLPSPLTDVSK